VLLAVLVSQSAIALGSTVAYWRFEEGPADTLIPHPAGDGVWTAGTADSSGNDYALSAWSSTWSNNYYRSDVPASTVRRTGAVNSFSIQNLDTLPGLWSSPDGALRTMSPAAFTIEASFKAEAAGYRTFVGRDSQGTVPTWTDLSALYFQLVPGDAIAAKFSDVSGYFHQAISAGGAVQLGKWYHAAAVSDGTWLRLYLYDVAAGTGYLPVAETNMAASGSPNTAMTPGAGFGGDWLAGNWTVGRGMYGGGHTDRFYGFIDEVRLSDTALPVTDFLFFDPDQVMVMSPSAWEAAVGDAQVIVNLAISAACNATQAVNVTVTSDAPTVAWPAGGTGGALVVHFDAGASTSQSVPIAFGDAGTAHFTLSASNCPSGAGAALTVTVHSAESIDLHVLHDIMRVGLTEQATVIASYGAAGTRDVTAASFGTTYTAAPAGVVSVSADGQVTAAAPGTAGVTASFGNLTSPQRTINVITPGDTVAYWRFEEGPADALIHHTTGDGVWQAGAADSSGNAYDLSAWSAGWSNNYYRTDVPVSSILGTGAANHFSIQNLDALPGLWTNPDSALRTMSPAAFTIEASFKAEVGSSGHRTFVGRDSQGTVPAWTDLSALYFQLVPGDGIAIKFSDVSGYFHEAVSAGGVVQAGKWYHAAAVSDGTWLRLYLYDVAAGTGYLPVADTNMVASGSSNTAMTAGSGSGGDWLAGNWTVGRGIYAGGHTDRFYGWIDEVRISSAALPVTQFLFFDPNQIMVLLPDAIDAAVGDAPASVTLAISAACNATQAVNVTVTSDAPTVAWPVDGTGGSLEVHFDAGSSTARTIPIAFGVPGTARFSLSSSSCPAGAGPALTANVHAAESIDLRLPYDAMRVGLTQQARVIASYGPAGTREVSAASFGTSYSVAPTGVVTVGPDGQIVAEALGTAGITASFSGLNSPQRTIKVVRPASTVAYWRFEEGPADTLIHHTAGDGAWQAGAFDSSGNGYNLSAWSSTWSNNYYRTDVPVSSIMQTGAVNTFSIQNLDGLPGLWSDPDAPLRTMSPAAFTIEASFKGQAGSAGYRTFVGRDSQGTVPSSTDLSALYFQLIPGDAIAFKFSDVSGFFHQAISIDGAVQADRWYHAAAVSDGSWLRLYLDDVAAGNGYQLVAETDIAASGSPDTAMSAGAGSGGDWLAGNWTVGRGMYAGGHTDRFYGWIDEVRISDAALKTTKFLLHPARPTADLNDDGYVDAVDVSLFILCTRGPAVALAEGCEAVDFDQDGDGDQNDFGLLQRCFAGSSIPASSECMDMP